MRLVEARRVIVAGAVAERAARAVSPGESVIISGPPTRFVGRGAEKLDAALDGFGLDVVGRRAIDVGASTGGFTDCLLQRGAAEVVAVDVGRGQLHERLRADPRVVILERTDIRAVDPASLGAAFDLLVADVSFISLVSVLPAMDSLVGTGADVVVLVKPQFEAGRAEASRGRGVIRDPQVRRRALGRVTSAMSSHGWAIMGVMVSPLTGADGNVELLVHAQARTQGGCVTEADLDRVTLGEQGS